MNQPSFSERLPRISFERRMTAPWWLAWVIPIVSVALALLTGALIIASQGVNPWEAYTAMFMGAFGSGFGMAETLVKAIPLMLAGLGVSIAFRMKLWNIGAEGQFIMGAFGASAVVLLPVLPPETSPWIFIPVMALAGIAAGALWGFVPGYLKARFNVNEIISTVMMNYIAVSWVNLFIFGVWSEGGFQMKYYQLYISHIEIESNNILARFYITYQDRKQLQE